MKKIVLFIVTVMIGITTSAADRTLEQYLAGRKAYSEKIGKPYDEAQAKKLFEKYDLNKDGVIDSEEWDATKKPKAK